MKAPTSAQRRPPRQRAPAAGKRGRPSSARMEQRDRELLDRALDLFLEKGFEGATIEAITDSIAMSPRTVYGRFRGKDALFKAALEKAVEEWSVPVAKLEAVACDDFEIYLLEIAKLLVANQTSPSGLRLTRIANVEVFRMPEIGAYLWERTAQPVLQFLTELFRTRLAGRELGPTEAGDAAIAFMILVVGGAFESIAWSRLSKDELDRQIVFRTRLFLAGARNLDWTREMRAE